MVLLSLCDGGGRMVRPGLRLGGIIRRHADGVKKEIVNKFRRRPGPCLDDVPAGGGAGKILTVCRKKELTAGEDGAIVALDFFGPKEDHPHAESERGFLLWLLLLF